jgi:acyl dehydratase
MSESKLLGRLPDGRTRAVAGHALADEFARAAQGMAERAAARPPGWRAVPFVGPFVVGDQLTVLGHELSAAVAGLVRGDELVWSASGERVAADQVLAGLSLRVRELGLAC